MSKVTSKLQLTVPKVIADRYGIRPGDELEWMASGESIRIGLGRKPASPARLTREERIELFDKGSIRLKKIQTQTQKRLAPLSGNGRGWKREDLYHRGLPR